eukprot:GHVH01004756.1.p1 GENE.GHVH01004756.1~~GHVH01004756.1.p1  ORF type:complete len:195 (+),score=14.57 GHVH01004756.1:59-586(+)
MESWEVALIVVGCLGGAALASLLLYWTKEGFPGHSHHIDAEGNVKNPEKPGQKVNLKGGIDAEGNTYVHSPSFTPSVAPERGLDADGNHRANRANDKRYKIAPSVDVDGNHELPKLTAGIAKNKKSVEYLSLSRSFSTFSTASHTHDAEGNEIFNQKYVPQAVSILTHNASQSVV